MSCLRGVSVVVFFVVLSAGPLFAQAPVSTSPSLAQSGATQTAADPLAFPTWELSGGYQMLHVPDQTFPFGLNVDGSWNLSSRFGVVGEVGWAFDSDDDVNYHAWNVGAGPRFTARMPGKVWPFAQVLGGFLHARGSGEINGVDVDASDTHFMLQPGGGAYINAGDGWGIVGQVDYRRVFLDEEEDGDSGQNQFRVFVGVRLLLD